MQNNTRYFRCLGDSKVFYLHIPKTAGSAINRLFCTHFGEDRVQTHIESRDLFDKEGCRQDVSGYNFLSGHITYPLVQKNINLSSWASICTFRRPEEQLVSHFSWVRLLAEPGHEGRLDQHTDSIRKIVNHMKDVDLASPSEISDFISWLEKNRFFIFHNTQTRYLCGGKPDRHIEPKLLNLALTNLDSIDFVGILERLDEFMLMLTDVFHLNVNEDSFAKENVNSERFGIDLSNSKTREFIEPLIAYDRIIYSRARERFIDQFHYFLAALEKGRNPRYTSVNVGKLKKDEISSHKDQS